MLYACEKCHCEFEETRPERAARSMDYRERMM